MDRDPKAFRKSNLDKSEEAHASERAKIRRLNRHLLPLQQATPPQYKKCVSPSLLSSTPPANLTKEPEHPETLQQPPRLQKKRKRVQEAEHRSSESPGSPPSKQPRTSPPQHPAEVEPREEIGSGISNQVPDGVGSWVQTGKWPSEYFEQDSQAGENFFEVDSWLEEEMEKSATPVVQYVEINGYRYPKPIKKLPASIRRKQSDASLTGSSDQNNREGKSTPYRDPRYPTLLATKGSYMDQSDLGVTKASLTWCKTLVTTEQEIPTDSLFRDDIFETTCRKVQDRNEARVIRSITPYIAPSAEDFETMGAGHLKCLIESVNEGWIGSIPLEGPQPRPDYSVGFRRSAFTDEQLNKLDPLLGTVFDTSFFVANFRMYLPFFACEVKCGVAGLDIADRQNAHSMTLAVRGVVELFRAIGREKELHREILAFSTSHDHRSVRIYGYYPVIEGRKTTFYRSPVHGFDFTILDGREKWTAYRFTKSLYDLWMPKHFERICSVIDQLPSRLDFAVPPLLDLEQPAEASGLSQGLGALLSEASEIGSASNQDDREVGPTVPPADTPDTSVSQVAKNDASLKRPKRKHTGK